MDFSKKIFIWIDFLYFCIEQLDKVGSREINKFTILVSNPQSKILNYCNWENCKNWKKRNYCVWSNWSKLYMYVWKCTNSDKEYNQYSTILIDKYLYILVLGTLIIWQWQLGTNQ
jgi:hypothetical protein